MSYIHRTMIVPAGALTALAQGLCEGLAGVADDGMFTTGLSATGKAPATHYISSGPISHDMAALLPCKTVTQDKDGKAVVTTAPGMPEAVPALATKAGISTTKAKITTLYTSIDVSDQPPFEAMARLGLQIVQVPLP
jgi:hypothetical protein